MKKLLALFLTLVLGLITLVGCGGPETAETSSEASSEESTVSETSSEEEESSSSKKESSSSKKKQGSSSSKKQNSGSKVKKPSSKQETAEEITYTEEEKMYNGMDPDLYTIGLKNKGDSSRIAALMKKAKKGGKYKIAVLGGSISAGAGASSKYSCYGNLVCEWWCSNFSDSDFEFINAGFGSTNPEMACYRMTEDLLKAKPDFVVVDFTVNTYLDSDIYNTYATILYKLLSQSNAPAVMSIDFTNCNKEKYELAGIGEQAGGVNPAITEVVKEYNIPAMSYHKYIWDKIDKKVIKWNDIGSDYIHPSDNGHLIAANLITAHLNEVKNNLTKYSGKVTAPAEPPSSSYMNLSYVINTAKGVTLSGGFSKNSGGNPSAKGWSYMATTGTSTLTVPIPENKEIKVFMKINSGSEGTITVTDSNNRTATIYSTDASTPTLVEIGKMNGKITFTPNFTKGGFTIYGVGARN